MPLPSAFLRVHRRLAQSLGPETPPPSRPGAGQAAAPPTQVGNLRYQEGCRLKPAVPEGATGWQEASSCRTGAGQAAAPPTQVENLRYRIGKRAGQEGNSCPTH